MNAPKPAKIALIDNHSYSHLAAIDILQLDHYTVVESDGTGDVAAWIASQAVDLVLMDVYLDQDQTGIDICAQLRRQAETVNLPVILMSAMENPQDRVRSRESGANAYIPKPLERVEFLNRIDLLIQRQQLADSLAQFEQVLYRVAEVIGEQYTTPTQTLGAEDLVTGFGKFVGLSPQQIDDLLFAARLHDLGMIQVPDSVVLKPAGLTPEGLTLVKQHVTVGAAIFEPLRHRQAVAKIMRHHHERWDGTGYPDHLQGDEIPYLAQVFQIIDIFSALTHPRQYNAATPIPQAIAILQAEAAKGWRNLELVAQFVQYLTQAQATFATTSG